MECSPYGADMQSYGPLPDADNTSEDEKDFRALMKQLDQARLKKMQKAEEQAMQASEEASSSNFDSSSSTEEVPL